MTDGGDERADVLERAGLEPTGDGRLEDVLPPWAAWRPVASWEAEPAVAVREDHPGLVAEVNARWHRLALELGVIGEDGEFLVDAAGTGRGPRRWRRVRLAGTWDLAGVLGDRPGRPEFLTLSTDGETLLGVTSEEYEIWLVAVDRITRRQEEAARAAAEETVEEREAAWRRLVRGPVTAGLRRAWAEGLRWNPAAPEDVRARLGAVASSPYPEAGSGAASQRADRAERAARDAHAEVRLRAATDPRLSAASAVLLLDDPREAVRAAAARHPRLPGGVLVTLLRRADAMGDAARNPALPEDVMRWMAG
ncbi:MULTISPECIES: hypothetical protein [Streptomyces]|uniref:PE-PGRS family protein n=1 Tax=Streptomyces griseocarneus TaxID=51201 RepID=A0ABX7RPI6_9ACTN|nr:MULTISPECIES: hypothetical protein [Streptomyces]QSY48834.1 hypothetical protein J3S04_28040 [Streptomyces griseocarneus]